MIGRIRIAAPLCVALAAVVAQPPTYAEQRIANVSQGTNLSLAIFPDRESIVVDLLGRLWRLPASGGGATPLTPDDEAARHPRVAPDGRSIVYERHIDGQSDLWLLDVESSERRPLLASEYDEREPDFTRDGRSVVFASDRSGMFSLWRIEIDTGVLTRLTAEPGDASFPHVSEHGEIAYVRREPDGWSLRALLPTGVPVELHRSPNRLTAPTWREGDGVIVFNEQSSAADGAAPSSELKMLVLSARPVVKALTRREDVFESRVAWLSPGQYLYAADGRIWRRGIAYASRDPVPLFAAVAVESSLPPQVDAPLDAPGPHPVRGIAGRSLSGDGRIELLSALGDLWLVERGGDARRLTDDEFVDVEPSVAPDGGFAVFVSDRGGDTDIWKIALPEGALTQLTRTRAGERAPVVGADGSVAFLETDGFDAHGDARLRVLPASGGVARTVASAPSGAESLAWDGASRIAVTLRGANGADAGRLAYDLATGGPRAPAAPAEASEPSALPALEWQAAASGGSYAIQVGRLFDATRTEYLRHVDVHVEGQRIKAVVARGMLPLPEHVIDLRDGTIIPGLIDVYARQSSLLGARLGRAWLAHGVTTVREVAADVPTALARAEAWASGRRLGPRLIVSPADGGHAPGSSGAEDFVRAATSDRNEKAPAGIGSTYPIPIRSYPSLRPASSVFRSVPQPALAPADAAAGALPYRSSPLGLAYDDVFNTIVASRTVVASGIAAAGGISAASALLRNIVRHPIFAQTYTDEERARWSAAATRTDAAQALQENLVRLIRAGGLVAVGSDSPRVPYGLGVHLEMALLADAGIPPDQVLRIATAGNALALGLDRQLGTLEAGKLADFVVVEGDPLSRITDALNVVAVVKGGVWIEQSRLF